MKEFDFYLEQKAAVWFRTCFSIKAKDAEEAREKAKKFILRGDYTQYDWDQGDEIELLPVDMNCDQPTEELYEQTSGDIIWNNVSEMQ